MYFYLKAFHIIFVVTWFAGLFYIVRLFIYHREALDKNEPEKTILIDQFKIMEKRLWYGITWPSAILTLIFGLSLAVEFMPLADNPWLTIKLIFVFLLFLYHLSCGHLKNILDESSKKYSSNQLRLWNEVATLFLFAIVFLVVLKETMGVWVGIFSLISLGVILMISIRFYRKLREK